MPSERTEMRLTKNRARCDSCGETIESLHRHDFRPCSCGAIAVDGGLAYARRVFDPGKTFTELSEYEPVE